MHRLGFALCIAAIASLIAAVPAGAVLPPGNSAATQYTEAYPTGGGNRPTNSGGKQTPAQALGKKNARELESMGAEGAAVARTAAETAPAGGSAGARSGAGGSGKAARGAGGGAGEAGPNATAEKGSSGFGEVLGSATGSSDSGELGLALPLVIVAALVGSFAYAWRRRASAQP